MTEPTVSPRLAELARARRLYATERPEGREELAESAIDVPATTADLRPLATVDPTSLDGLERVATRTAGVFLVVHADDTAEAVERIADAALRADLPESPAELPVEPRPDSDPVGALAVAHVADLRGRVSRLAHTVALMPASRRQVVARAAVADVDRQAAAVLRALGVDDEGG